MVSTAKLPETDFSTESVSLCQTPEELVQSGLFTKALEKILEPQDVQYLQSIVEKRLKQSTFEWNSVVRDKTQQWERWNYDFTKREQAYLDSIEQDEELLWKFNTIINTIEYISKKKWSDMHEAQDLPHFDSKGNADAKKVLAWLQDKKSTETQVKTFCGVAIENLTSTQKELFDRLTPKQREALAQKVSINKTEGQIEFLQIKKAIKDSDTATNVTKKSADDTMKKLGNGWKLPRDVDFDDKNRLKLNPEESDYDAMILQMPWASDNEKVENFRLLTGMNWWYWTAQNYNKSSSEFVFREFSKNVRDRDRDGVDYNDNIHVRPVRSL